LDAARVEVRAFIDDMPARFAEASLVMARSGASTVAELAAAGKPTCWCRLRLRRTRTRSGMRGDGCGGCSGNAGGAGVVEPGRLLAELTGLLKDQGRLEAMGSRRERRRTRMRLSGLRIGWRSWREPELIWTWRGEMDATLNANDAVRMGHPQTG